MVGGWLFFRETNPHYLMGSLHLSPRASTPVERALGIHLFVLGATWAIPLFVNDLWTLTGERWTGFNRWLESLSDGLTLVGAQAVAVGRLPRSRWSSAAT